MGRDHEAASVLPRLAALAARVSGTGSLAFDASIALAAIPARFALERGDWAAAARPPSPTGPSSASAANLVRLVRALGAARDGQPSAARVVLADFDDAGRSFESLRQLVQAWVMFADGREAEAVAAMESVVALDDSDGAAGLWSAPLLPPREALGELLLEAGRIDEALDAFEGSLASTPNRTRSLYGAAIAAERAGRVQLSLRYFGRMVEVTANASQPLRPILAEARVKTAGPR
jgi:tetratricopeptide (TPR) repeat protein